jgi:hypothetical protein
MFVLLQAIDKQAKIAVNVFCRHLLTTRGTQMQPEVGFGWAFTGLTVISGQ